MRDLNDYAAGEIAPQGENPLPRINADPDKAPDKVQVEWILTSPPVPIGPEPRTVALIRGRFGEVQLRSIRVQFPLDLPDDFVASVVLYPSRGLVTKRGIVVARLQGKNRASCHCDLPPPLPTEMVEPVWSEAFRRCTPGACKADYLMWAGVRSKMVASPQRALALLVQANHRVLCQAFIGGV